MSSIPPTVLLGNHAQTIRVHAPCDLVWGGCQRGIPPESCGWFTGGAGSIRLSHLICAGEVVQATTIIGSSWRFLAESSVANARAEPRALHSQDAGLADHLVAARRARPRRRGSRARGNGSSDVPPRFVPVCPQSPTIWIEPGWTRIVAGIRGRYPSELCGAHKPCDISSPAAGHVPLDIVFASGIWKQR